MTRGAGNKMVFAAYMITVLAAEVAHSFLLLPLLGAALYKAYLKEGIQFRENVFLDNEPILQEYDFVVIGAGPGGSVVSGRLSEVANWKILLLEAGEDENIYTDIPNAVTFWPQTNYNWGYRAERANGSCLSIKDQRCPWPRGKGLGGSSIINFMIYTRGHKKDYDEYEAAGNKGWSYDDVLPYFLKSENNSIPEYADSPIHAHEGPLHVERVRHKSVLVDAFQKGAAELGYKTNVDYTEPITPIGVSRIQATTRRGRRQSAAKAYLKPNRFRTNLHVSIKSRVTKILIDPDTKRAYGVEFVKDNRKRVVYARKEVILSAGALNSPQILMLSGIGPKEHLQQHCIPVIQDLRVGENLQEHYTYVGLSFVVNKGCGFVLNRVKILEAFKDWHDNGRGILTMPGFVEGIGYGSTKQNNDTRPDIEYIFIAASLGADAGTAFRNLVGITQCTYDENFKPFYHNKDSWTMVPMILHPKSRGKILLKDKNPWSAPKFYFDYFEREEDLEVLIEAAKETIRWSESKAFRSLGTKLDPTPVRQCAHHVFKSDEYWGCVIRHFTVTLHHQCGTCKMGPKSDPAAVVDSQLKVHGVSGLRVVDASIFPNIPGAHLYAPTLMVGEKAADMIKSTWKVTAAGATWDQTEKPAPCSIDPPVPCSIQD